MADDNLLAGIETIEDAEREANALAASYARTPDGSLFFGNLAARLLTPLLWAAASGGRGLDDVRRWLASGAPDLPCPPPWDEALTPPEALTAAESPTDVQTRQALARLAAGRDADERTDRNIRAGAGLLAL